MIDVRPATTRDAAGMGSVHVGVWRSAYAGILPDGYLAKLSAPRQAAYYQAGILRGHSALVAEADGRVVGFATMSLCNDSTLGQSEIETLYVSDDWRDQGTGRRLMQTAGGALAGQGAASTFLWVLSDNPSRWFYQRLGGRRVAEGQTRVAGASIPRRPSSGTPSTCCCPEMRNPECRHREERSTPQERLAMTMKECFKCLKF